MTADNDQGLRLRDPEVAVLGVEGAGDASCYGRRVEIDRSWTVYHLFTGVPAEVDGRVLVALDKAEATEAMRALNFSDMSRS